jgi:dynein heavy chain
MPAQKCGRCAHAQVLDDNMMLCLSNGERVRLEPNMRLLFEVSDLESASPATVSRLGVVYVAGDTVGWMPYVHSWLQVCFCLSRVGRGR